MQNLQEILDKLPTDRERYEWNRMLQSTWFKELSPRLQEFVISLPPIYQYETRGQLVEITQYDEDKEDPNAPITVVIAIKPEANSQYLFERRIQFTPAHELKRGELLRVAKIQKLMSDARNLGRMQRLINTKDREDVMRGQKGQW